MLQKMKAVISIKKFLVLMMISCLLFVTFFYIYHNRELLGYEKKIVFQWRHLFEQVQSERKSIFFLETSNRTDLLLRQACAVESAALTNPSAEVILFMTISSKSNPLHNILQQKYGIRFIPLRFEEIFNGTPIENFYKEKALLESFFRIKHLSDAGRFVLLWKFGGIYLDLDFVVMKPLGDLHNSVVLESGGSVASAVLFFERGHPFLTRCIEEVHKTRNLKKFGVIGPPLVSRILKEYCHISDFNTKNCNVSALPKETMMPVHYNDWKSFFDSNEAEKVMTEIENSYGIHLWNGYSESTGVPIGSDCAYERVAKLYCPVSYSFAKDLGKF